MWQVFKDLLHVAAESARAKKARRLLFKQEWSVDFLEALLCKARELNHKGVYVILKNKFGQELTIIADDRTQVKPNMNEQHWDALYSQMKAKSEIAGL